ncbi:unnamed protein product [Cuscuta epithymum]|uniref:Uncharacterized protein n=1 Tax=Cuscuta epithymum TaxID=186058 RepID=A0AAV0FRC0_9ASTE|nr:unnamed protein product [Cuscuta epithymum]
MYASLGNLLVRHKFLIVCILVVSMTLMNRAGGERANPDRRVPLKATTTTKSSDSATDDIGASHEGVNDDKKGEGEVELKGPLKRGRMPAFHGKEIKDCLPKGFKHASAPSRYVNYHILGSFRCSDPPHLHHHQKP